MNKKGGNVILRFLLMSGALRHSFILVEKKTGFFWQENFNGSRVYLDPIINKINNFDGLCYVYTGLETQKHLEDSVLINNLILRWDNSKEAKRAKRLQKIKIKITA